MTWLKRRILQWIDPELADQVNQRSQLEQLERDAAELMRDLDRLEQRLTYVSTTFEVIRRELA